MKKSIRVLRTILIVLASLAFLMAGMLKLIGNATEVIMFTKAHLTSMLSVIGLIEVLVAVMLWWRKTRDLATLLGTAIMGAAFAEVITLGAPMEVLSPGIILLLLWAIFAIDHHHYRSVNDNLSTA